ncbi:hypothetical protein FA95DRAFT_1551934 [Auriscalpium vulgare]|uniref:Uncharacterized protein n=1 Tax=Auriscalpium vulgare TaxID=40419 RepID=A0ACB8SCZ1_9AGAM|nr:hypothetical protein FA95DRAFT_1551934 [Auriscalpium vulgare]
MLVVLGRSAGPACIALRTLHSSSVRLNRVAPPDPISNIRPILYDDPLPPTDEELRHPYSLSEFRGDMREYQWKLQRQQLDSWNHAFWTDSNTRFNAGKAAALDSLPETASPEMQERAVATFYRNWVLQEAERQEEYAQELRRRSIEEIKLAFRVHYQNFKARLSG